MRRISLSLVLALLTCCVAFAESSVWKVQKDGATIYLGGTCHVLRESDYPLPAEFEKGYRASDLVVFETDIGKLQDPSMQQKLLAKSMYAGVDTVEKHLSAKVYGELGAFCQASGFPIAALNRLRPSMIIMTLTVLELKKQGATQEGVDQFFYSLATADKKPIERLETVEEQIDYLVSMADGNEDEFVSYSLQDMTTLKKQFNNLADAWRKGDAGKLNEWMVKDLKTRQPKLYKRLLADRNRNWLPMIEAYLKTPKTEFILVGAGHLVGPDGLIEMLRKKGCRVEQL